MALFNVLAKKPIEIEWDIVHHELNPSKFELLIIFPIPSEIGISCDSIGIYSSGKNEHLLREVKKELILVLEFLWSKNFEVIDLFKGVEVTSNTYPSVYNYL